ncbi:CAP domain-containing protein [bacterium]|nr:CAP domain-containing protein [bacterium]MCI0603628.1 CAP domain-containing protein [bacterium]
MRKTNSAAAIFLILFLPLFVFAESDQEKQLFEFVNSERLREKLMPLLWDEDLYHVALAHSKDMATRGKASHEGSDGRQPYERIQDAKIYASKTGENIARDLNVISAHTLLMQSLYHRENILEPEFTHSAIGIVKERQFIYITELFIHRVGDYSVDQARQTLVKQYNFYRQDKKLGPLVLSESLSNAAQAHVETQKKFDSLSPMLLMSSVARTNRGATLVSVYTTTGLLEIPAQVRSDLESNSRKLGIGFKRIQGSICGGGCYLIVLVFG